MELFSESMYKMPAIIHLLNLFAAYLVPANLGGLQ